MIQTKVSDNETKRKCFECKKYLKLFEGYRHPTLGPHHLLCRDCYEKIENSVEHWGRRVLWDSFNPESPDPTFLDSYPYPPEGSEIAQKKPRNHKL